MLWGLSLLCEAIYLEIKEQQTEANNSWVRRLNVPKNKSFHVANLKWLKTFFLVVKVKYTEWLVGMAI